MSTLSLGARGKITGFDRFTQAVPFLTQLFEQVENWSKNIGADNLLNSAITTPKLNNGAVTQEKVAEGVARVASGLYTEDGATANRVITVGAWTPKRVVVLRTDATPITFESIGSVGDVRAWYRIAIGDFGNDTINWQGIVSGGFKLGSSATGSSNINGVEYVWWAEG